MVEIGGKERGRVSRGQMIVFHLNGTWVVGQVQSVSESGKTKVKIGGQPIETETLAAECLSKWAVVRKMGGRRHAAHVESRS